MLSVKYGQIIVTTLGTAEMFMYTYKKVLIYRSSGPHLDSVRCNDRNKYVHLTNTNEQTQRYILPWPDVRNKMTLRVVSNYGPKGFKELVDIINPLSASIYSQALDKNPATCPVPRPT